ARSCLNGLIKFVTHIRENNKAKLATIAVFLDIEKAFDSANHKCIIEACINSGIRGKLLNITTNFLKNRKMYVKVDNEKTEEFEVNTGIPQGSVLSPLLFNLVMKNLILEIDNEIHISIFADDVVIWLSAHEKQLEYLE